MTALKLCGAVIICLCAAAVLKKTASGYGFLCVITGAAGVFACCFGTSVKEAVTVITELSEKSGVGDYAGILLKALGISYLTVITADICKSAGEEMLAGTAILAGKCEILLLCLPLVSRLIGIASGML